MEVEQVLFQSAQDQGVICAALKSTLDLFADDEILGIENDSVDELERALPVRLGLLVSRFLGDEHRMHEQRLMHAIRKHAEMTDVVGVIHENAIGEYEVHQGGVHLRTPPYGRNGPDLSGPI